MIKNLLRIFVTFAFLIVVPAYAEPIAEDDYYSFPEDCSLYYDEIVSEFDSVNIENEITDEWIAEYQYAIKDKKEAASPHDAYEMYLKATKELLIAEAAIDCVSKDERYIKNETRLCLSSTVEPSIKTYFDKLKKKNELLNRENEYCEIAEQYPKIHRLLTVEYLKGRHLERNLPKAIYHLDKLKEVDPKEKEFSEFLKAIIYRHGDYGIDKDDSKAFKLLNSIEDKEKLSQLPCELSLHYRHGIGTDIDIKQADHLLSIHHKLRNNDECKLTNLNIFFGD